MASRRQEPLLWGLGLLAGGALALAAGKYNKVRLRRIFAEELRLLAGPEAKLFSKGEEWFVRLPLTPGHTAVLPLGEEIKDSLEARKALMTLLAEGAPPLLAEGEEAPIEEVVIVKSPLYGWAYHIPCLRCGGYHLPLEAPEQTEPLFVRAMTAHMRPLPLHCLNCLSRAIRSGREVPEGLWFDTSEQIWQWAQSVDEDHALSFPLGVGYYVPQEMLERARRAFMNIGPYDQDGDSWS